MIRLSYFSLFLLLAQPAFTQGTLKDNLKNLEGIWIAEKYFSSFEITRSSVTSKYAFDPHYPIGLRINLAEVKNDSLNIGYGCLHDHLFRPEVSEYFVVGKDTIHEQGFFKINISKSDSLHFHQTTVIYDFNYESKAYFTWAYTPDTTLILYRPASNSEPEETIAYVRIVKTFADDNHFPNPIYYYTRSKTIVGEFVLMDSLNSVVSDSLYIGYDGKASGYMPFENKIFYFSTDIYCGPETTNDIVCACTFREDFFQPECDLFIYKKVDDKVIQFHQVILPSKENNYEAESPGKMLYKLKRK